ncbi:hypothetical protein N9A07_01310 [Candidatus Pelagibacter ubique]|nr:hypothetical protein [Candidatus Pelagibacter ubique]
MAGIIEVKDQGKLRIYDADNSNYIDIVVPSTVSSNRTVTLPDASFTVPTVGGITMADQWVLTTDFSGDASPISSNLARYTADSSGYFGTGMTESSGVFTFPQTGNYLIKFKSNFILTGADAQAQQAIIRITTDNSSFSNASASVQTQFRWGSSSPSYYNNSADYIFDVTDVSTHKCSFEIDVSDNNTVTRGDSNQLETSMQFIRLGE